MAKDKRLNLMKIKCPTCKVNLLIKASVNVCPACRSPLPKSPVIDRATERNP
jgi:Zn finger protein HypA/HybF involved in hydrogenase expression